MGRCIGKDYGDTSQMSVELGVIGFVSILPIGLLLIALLKDTFVGEEVIDIIIRGGLYFIGTALYALATSVVWHISSTNSLGVEQEISVYFYISMYLCIGFSVIFGAVTIFKAIQGWLLKKQEQRGYMDEQERY